MQRDDPTGHRPAGPASAAPGSGPDAVLAALAHRLRARSERQQLLTERLRSGELRPGALADLAELAAAARRGVRDGDHVLVMAGAPVPERGGGGALPLGQVLSAAVAASEAASRTVVPPTPSVLLDPSAGPVFGQILAELLAHATAATSPGERLELHTRWGPDGGLVLELLSPRPVPTRTPVDELDRMLGAGRPDGPVAPQEIGLHLAARLARSIGGRLGVRGAGGPAPGSSTVAVLYLPQSLLGGGRPAGEGGLSDQPSDLLAADGRPDPSLPGLAASGASVPGMDPALSRSPLSPPSLPGSLPAASAADAESSVPPWPPVPPAEAMPPNGVAHNPGAPNGPGPSGEPADAPSGSGPVARLPVPPPPGPAGPPGAGPFGNGPPGNGPSANGVPGNGPLGNGLPANGPAGGGPGGSGFPGNAPAGNGLPGGSPGAGSPGNGPGGNPSFGNGLPAAGLPGSGPSGNGLPGTGPSGAGLPGGGSSGGGLPGTGASGNGQPGNGQPGNGQPGNGQPGNGQPGNGQPGNGQPGNGQPGNGQPGGGQSGGGPAGTGAFGNGLPGTGPSGNGLPGHGPSGNGHPGNAPSGNGLPGNGLAGNGVPANGLPGNGPWGAGMPGNGLAPSGNGNGMHPGTNPPSGPSANVNPLSAPSLPPSGPGGATNASGALPVRGGPRNPVPPGVDIPSVTEAMPVPGTTPPVELFGPFNSEAPVPLDDMDGTPIFAAVASAWFRDPVPPQIGGAPVDPAPPPSNGRRPDEPANWSSPGDAEFDAARSRANRVVEPPATTANGLPVRRPGQQMVPPSRRDVPEVGPRRPSASERQPERVRSRLASYQRGLREGRHRAAEEHGAGAGPAAGGRVNGSGVNGHPAG